MPALEALVEECPYFEYLLTDAGSTFGIFDTHHNALVCVGDINRAASAQDATDG